MQITQYNSLINLNKSIVQNIESVFSHFDYYPRKTPRRYDGPCPIHEGDRSSAFNLYHSGHTSCGNWYCNTQGCHNLFSSSPLGLIRGLLSKENGWRGFGDKEREISVQEAAKYYKDNFDFTQDGTVDEIQESHKFNPSIKNHYAALPKLGTIDSLYCKLTAPYYFVNRGFSKETLAKFYVGRCETFGRPMFCREVAPILDVSGRFVVGATGRSINPECPRCHVFHSKTKPCPPKEKEQAYSKWKHSATNMTHILYNLWNAKEEWKLTRTAILVESPVSVWRMDEAGIRGHVGSFGAHLTYEQSLLFKEYGVEKIKVLTDNDAAGENCRSQIDYICDGRYTVEHARLPLQFNDPADMPIQELQQYWNSLE